MSGVQTLVGEVFIALTDSAPIKFCGIKKKKDLLIAYSLFVQASCLS